MFTEATTGPELEEAVREEHLWRKDTPESDRMKWRVAFASVQVRFNQDLASFRTALQSLPSTAPVAPKKNRWLLKK